MRKDDLEGGTRRRRETIGPSLVFLYLAVVVDAFSRRVIGWAMANHLKTEFVLEVLEMAIEQRYPQEVIHHSEHGSQYTLIAFGNTCKKAGVRRSMGTLGDRYDNATCESFFATLECELFDREKFASPSQVRLKVFEFIEGSYNLNRRHSSIGYDSPMGYEEKHAARLVDEGGKQSAVYEDHM